MHLSDLAPVLEPQLYQSLLQRNIAALRPSQEKAIAAGLLEGQNLVVCTPTASGKTLIAELAALQRIFHHKGKAVYIVPLKALAHEKYREFKERYPSCVVALASGDLDSTDAFLGRADIIVATAEKMDSLLRHRVQWIPLIGTVIIDEIHLLHDAGRGPTLEVVITLLRRLTKSQYIALSATIGNPKALADWLNANLVVDSWRPVPLKRGIYLDGEIEFFEVKK